MNAPPAILTELPPEWPEDPLPGIRKRVSALDQSIVVLDDDPTGTQTVYDTPVLTSWAPEHLIAEFERQTPLFYILTNSRSMTAPEAEELNREVAASLLAAREAIGRDYTVISRSDSTLRGHFPLETDVLAEALDEGEAVCLVIPFFLEGGRLTVDDTHYVVEGNQWTPAAETPFAKDAVFGFQSSHLPQWVEEKTAGRHPAHTVGSIGLDTVRKGPEAVTEHLQSFPPGSVGVVNALSMRDVEVVVAAILDAEEKGKRFLYRTAASFVRARAGLSKQPLLTRSDLVDSSQSRGGLVIVGSYVPKTTQQLQCLLASKRLRPMELKVPDLLEGQSTDDILDELNSRLANGESCVVYTSRDLVQGKTDLENLQIGQTVSDALVGLVKRLDAAPSYLIAKGGITSSDLATKAMKTRRALVRGQLLPGIPVWEPDESSLFPGLPYVVFPGNVGSDQALLDAVKKLESP